MQIIILSFAFLDFVSNEENAFTLCHQFYALYFLKLNRDGENIYWFTNQRKVIPNSLMYYNMLIRSLLFMDLIRMIYKVIYTLKVMIMERNLFVILRQQQLLLQTEVLH